jgi:hypothetical protein
MGTIPTTPPKLAVTPRIFLEEYLSLRTAGGDVGAARGWSSFDRLPSRPEPFPARNEAKRVVAAVVELGVFSNRSFHRETTCYFARVAAVLADTDT